MTDCATTNKCNNSNKRLAKNAGNVTVRDGNDKEVKNVKKTWDKGLDFEKIKAELEAELEKTSRGPTYSNIATLYIQLINGSRVSEAVDAFNEFLAFAKRDLEIRVRKRWRKDKKTGKVVQIIEYRKMLIPSSIKRRGTPRTPTQVKVFAHRKGFNTHSLRYAFVSHLGKRGVAPQIIAKITPHKRLERIIDYTSQKVADDLLKEVAES
jgi:hypothetical protein